jgi:hypothetical protein
MERPPQHITETQSIKIFEQIIPSEWIIRDISPDYGLDKSIEIVEGGKVTGKEVFVQLKGTNTINTTDGFVSYTMEVKNLKYYLERDIPVVLTVVDIPSKRCYWLFIQQYIYGTLDLASPNWKQQETVTVKIPVSNDLVSTIPQLKCVALGGTTYILLKKLDKIPIEQLEHWESNSQAIKRLEEVGDKFLQKQFEINFDISYRLQTENDYEKSIDKLMEIAEQSKSKDPATHSKAILLVAYHLNPMSNSKEIFQLLESIKKTVKTSHPALQIIWEGEYLETLFAKLMKDLNTYRMMYALASNGPQGTMAPYIGVEMHSIVNGLYNIEKDFLSLLDRAIQIKQFVLYLDLQRRLLKMQFLWCYNNSLEGNPTINNSQIDSIKKSLISALQLAKNLSKDIEFELCIDLAFVCASIEDYTSRDKYLESALELAKSLNHKGFLEGVQSTKQHLQRSMSIPTMINSKTAQVTDEDISDEEEERLAKVVLERAGIDIKSDDELAKMARVGLKDRNPERILKYCEHLYAEVVTYGPIWETVGLPTTGMKILFCEKKGVSIMGYELDGLLEDMKKDCCSTCKDLCPRPADWKWTHVWHRTRGQPELMNKIIRNYHRN